MKSFRSIRNVTFLHLPSGISLGWIKNKYILKYANIKLHKSVELDIPWYGYNQLGSQHTVVW